MDGCPVCNSPLVFEPNEMGLEIYRCPKCDTLRVMDIDKKLRLMRKSPGANWYAICMAMKLAGKCFGTKEDAQKAFSQAAKECSKGK